MAVQFFFNASLIKLSERRRLKLFINQLFKEERMLFSSLSYVFCSDQYLLSINREFLQHDDYTDIITFCLSGASEPVEGEIYISTDRVKENAISIGTSINNELHRVIFHGALHLCGYKDKKPSDKRKMTDAEDKYLQLYFG